MSAPGFGHAWIAKLHLGCGDIFVLGGRISTKRRTCCSAVRRPRARARPLGGSRRGHVESTFPKGIIFADILKGLPYPDGSASHVYHAHLIEHLSHDQGRILVQECARLLAPGEVMRIATPNLADYIDAYNRGDGQDGETHTRGDVFMRSIGTYEEQPETTAQRYLRTVRIHLPPVALRPRLARASAPRGRVHHNSHLQLPRRQRPGP